MIGFDFKARLIMLRLLRSSTARNCPVMLAACSVLLLVLPRGLQFINRIIFSLADFSARLVWVHLES